MDELDGGEAIGVGAFGSFKASKPYEWSYVYCGDR